MLDSIRSLFPRTDVDILDYVKGYLADTPVDDYGQAGENLFDFLGPLLCPDADDDVDSLRALCAQVAADTAPSGKTAASYAVRELEPEKRIDMQSYSLAATSEYAMPKRVTDISLSSTNQRVMAIASKVEQRNLEKAEAKALKKGKKNDSGVTFVDLKADKTDYNALNMTIDPTTAKGKTRDIKLENFDISFAGKRILSAADLTLVFGRRYGLIGRNGVGKSTLLRAISRRDIGGVNKNGGVPEWLRILHVEQEIGDSEETVISCVLKADAYRVALIKQEKDLSARLKELDNNPAADVKEKDKISLELKAVYAKQMEIEADKAESKAATILSGLGFSAEEQVRPTKTFSGGWRMRIALARALFCKPDVLLLDEPTNHLDINAVVWLEKYVQNWPNTLIVVSHDRDFLDAIATDMIHMHNEHCDQYRGNYTTFLATRSERRKNQIREYEAQLQYRKHLQDFIDRWRYNAKRAPQAQSKIKILEKLPPLSAPEDDGVDDGELTFKWPDPVDKLSPPILLADDVSFSYQVARDDGTTVEKPILKNVSFSVLLGSRVAIVGANGAGKTTLLKLLIGQLEPTKGIIQKHGRLRIAYFSQHHMDALESDEVSASNNPVEFLTEKFPGYSEEEYRRMLGRFGLTGMTALQPMQTLSGGQKSRVVFAMMALNNPHILVLDEVTNHLDIMTIDSLIKALNPNKGFQGGVIVVSHDARFVDQVCNEMWICKDGTVNKFKVDQRALVLGEDDDLEGKSGIMEYKKKILKEIDV